MNTPDPRTSRDAFDLARQIMLGSFRDLLAAVPADEARQEAEATASALRQLVELAR